MLKGMTSQRLLALFAAGVVLGRYLLERPPERLPVMRVLLANNFEALQQRLTVPWRNGWLSILLAAVPALRRCQGNRMGRLPLGIRSDGKNPPGKCPECQNRAHRLFPDFQAEPFPVPYCPASGVHDVPSSAEPFPGAR